MADRRASRVPSHVPSVIYDLDGTLADTAADLIAAANACFEAMGAGRPLDPVADAGTGYLGGRAMLRLGFERLGRPAAPEEIDGWYPPLLEAYESRIDAETVFFPGALEAAEALRAQGYAVGICTNKPERLARLLMERLDAAELFAALVGADTLPTRKPDPAPFHEAVARAVAASGGETAGRALLVGDTVTDRDTARAAGVPVALVSFGPNGAAARALEPDALLPAHSALPELAARLLRAAA